MGKELIPETSDNFYILTWLVAQENFTVCPDLLPCDEIETSHSFYLGLEGSLAYKVTLMQGMTKEEPSFAFT
jgi:hypothetical protein